MSLRSALLLGSVSLFLLGGPAMLLAQQNSNSPFGTDQLWEFGVWGGEAFGKEEGQAFGETQLTLAGFDAARVIGESSLNSGKRRSLEYVIELYPAFFVTRTHPAYGGGFSPIGLKWNFAPRRNGRYRPYLEMNGGSMFTQQNVPQGRTDNFNFTASLGPGVMVALSRRQALSLGLRYWHLSNANLGYANPSFNTIQFVVGYHWLLTGRGGRQRQASTGAPAAGAASTAGSAAARESVDRRVRSSSRAHSQRRG